MLQLNTVFRVLSKKFLMTYIIMTATIIESLQGKGSRGSQNFVFNVDHYRCATDESLGGEIVINKTSNQVATLFSLYLNYGAANGKILDFQWKDGADRLVIPVFFPQLVDSQSGAYAPAPAGSGINIAVFGFPSGVSISYCDRSHEIIAGSYDPVAELCKLCPNITSDWD